MSHTWGEWKDLSSKFFDSLEKHSEENLEEALKKENIIKAFLSYIPDSYKSELNEDKEYIYEEILNLKDDVSEEYKHLKQQFDELINAIDTREKYFISKKNQKPNTPEQKAENQKLDEYLSQLKQMKEDISKINLVQMALRNSKKFTINRFFPIKNDFSLKLFQVNTLDSDRRKYINFGELPLSEIENIPDEKIDYDNYMIYFGRMITDFQILERIQERIKGNHLMSERLHIVSEALKYFKLNDFQMFVHIIVPQLEGFFRIYLSALHNHQKTKSISDIVNKIRENGDFLEYIYFAYDFPLIRNSIAHGELPDITRERAYEILMDLHWIVSKIDSDELDYKKCILCLKDFDKAPNKIKFILDYFQDDSLDLEAKLENLKKFLSHYYSKIIKDYGLFDVGSKFIETLKSNELHSAIWNENMPDTFTKKAKKKNIITLDGQKQEYKISEENEFPSEYSSFVEILNQNKLCPDEWYNGYKTFLR